MEGEEFIMVNTGDLLPNLPNYSTLTNLQSRFLNASSFPPLLLAGLLPAGIWQFYQPVLLLMYNKNKVWKKTPMLVGWLTTILRIYRRGDTKSTSLCCTIILASGPIKAWSLGQSLHNPTIYWKCLTCRPPLKTTKQMFFWRS
eukprot:Lithocolla_globosa_v1_NODE_7341_length_958_cov_60.196013.p2 type:complete len:143 gc:universal NODE_7341_length_958_cov_60.196013:740-312(-)